MSSIYTFHIVSSKNWEASLKDVVAIEYVQGLH